MNFITCTLEKKGEDLYLTFGNNSVKLPADKANNPALKEYIGQQVVAGIRPECLHDEPMYISSMTDSLIDASVDVTELMGSEIYLYLGFDGQEDATNGKSIIARVSSRSTARAGDTIKIALDASRIHIFDKDTERCIIH
jgi:multiple sugar transport system ATP-binding protein